MRDWIKRWLKLEYGPIGMPGPAGPAGKDAKCECAEEIRSLRVRVSYLEGKLANLAFIETLLRQAK